MRPGECELCPTHGLGYCYRADRCLRADVKAPTRQGICHCGQYLTAHDDFYCTPIQLENEDLE